MHEDFGERLRHGGMVRETWCGFNSIAHVKLSRRD
jgi:hypothetical protein